jgi:murein L,D-transpeptidase YafK
MNPLPALLCSLLACASPDSPFSTPVPTREPPSLAEASRAGLQLVIDKSDRELTVVSGGAIVRRWPVGLGFDPVGDKAREGDGRTPEGRFRVARRLPDSQYYKAWLLDYPLPEDAERGLADGLIDGATAESSRQAHAAGGVPPQYTPLGGLIEVHGRGSGSDWTLGCVALDDAVMDELWPHVGVGTTILVRP